MQLPFFEIQTGCAFWQFFAREKKLNKKNCEYFSTR